MTSRVLPSPSLGETEILYSISKLIETKNDSECLIGYLDVFRPSVLTLPKTSGNNSFKDKDRNKDKKDNIN